MARILVVDDDAAQRQLLDLLLRREGYQTVGAECALKAFDVLHSDTEFDAILSDLRMPGMDGAQFLKEARRLYPHVPVIVMTALAGSQWMTEAQQNGASGCLAKPFRAMELFETLRTARALVAAQACRT